MEIHGGAGGLVFGFHDNNQGYYRVDITNNSSGANKLTVHYCSANSCTSHNADDGQSLATTTPSIDKQNQLTLAVMVNDDNYISFYVQGKYVTSISSSSGPASGQIGVYAVSFDSNPSEGTDASHPNGSTASSNTQGKTEVLFTKVQVWQFPLPSPSPSKPI